MDAQRSHKAQLDRLHEILNCSSNFYQLYDAATGSCVFQNEAARKYYEGYVFRVDNNMRTCAQLTDCGFILLGLPISLVLSVCLCVCVALWSNGCDHSVGRRRFSPKTIPPRGTPNLQGSPPTTTSRPMTLRRLFDTMDLPLNAPTIAASSATAEDLISFFRKISASFIAQKKFASSPNRANNGRGRGSGSGRSTGTGSGNTDSKGAPVAVGGIPVRKEQRTSSARRSGPSKRWHSMSVVDVMDPVMHKRCVVIIQTDATQVANLADDLQHFKEKEDDKLATFSHELRTPLNGIIGLAESLGQRPEFQASSTVQKSIEAIVSCGKDLAKNIEAAMEFNTVSDHDEFENDNVNLLDVVANVLELAADLRDDHVTFVNKVKDFRGLVYGNSVKLERILLQLLDNACKFTSYGSITISARILDGGDFVEISVDDTGCGIAPEQMHRIFGQFEQGDMSATRHFGGLGLGLSLCRKLVEDGGGDIEVDSVEGEGSCFRFTVPTSASVLEAVQMVRKPTGTLMLEADTAISPRPAKPKNKSPRPGRSPNMKNKTRHEPATSPDIKQAALNQDRTTHGAGGDDDLSSSYSPPEGGDGGNVDGTVVAKLSESGELASSEHAAPIDSTGNTGTHTNSSPETKPQSDEPLSIRKLREQMTSSETGRAEDQAANRARVPSSSLDAVHRNLQGSGGDNANADEVAVVREENERIRQDLVIVQQEALKLREKVAKYQKEAASLKQQLSTHKADLLQRYSERGSHQEVDAVPSHKEVHGQYEVLSVDDNPINQVCCCFAWKDASASKSWS